MAQHDRPPASFAEEVKSPQNAGVNRLRLQLLNEEKQKIGHKVVDETQ